METPEQDKAVMELARHQIGLYAKSFRKKELIAFRAVNRLKQKVAALQGKMAVLKAENNKLRKKLYPGK